MKTIFLDSSVLFSAVKSPTGGSSKLFTLKFLKPCTSLVVLAEVERNVRSKLEDYHLQRFFLLISHLAIITQIPKRSIIKRAQRAIIEKDAVILAEAKQAKADILVTLDKKHFLTESARKFLQPKKIMTPKMMIEKWGK